MSTGWDDKIKANRDAEAMLGGPGASVKDYTGNLNDLSSEQIVANLKAAGIQTNPKLPNFILPDGTRIGDFDEWFHNVVLKSSGLLPKGASLPYLAFMDRVLRELDWVRCAGTSFEFYQRGTVAESNLEEFLRTSGKGSGKIYVDVTSTRKSYFFSYEDFSEAGCSLGGVLRQGAVFHLYQKRDVVGYLKMVAERGAYGRR